MNDPALSATRKESKTNSMRRSEANFLRFLRTHERPQNYNTLKIIGKGAFGEVRLVQRKHDGKIYALKSLIKQEMVSILLTDYKMKRALTLSSTKKTSWPTFVPSVIFWPTPIALGWSSYIHRSRTTHSYTCSWSSCLVAT